MSVIVKGMEMPKCCDKCEFNHLFADAEWCDFLDDPIDITVDTGKERPKDCPIIPLPEKHGRLISAKKIEFELCESNMPKQYRDFCRRVLNDENLTPTVVESEE